MIWRRSWCVRHGRDGFRTFVLWVTLLETSWCLNSLFFRSQFPHSCRHKMRFCFFSPPPFESAKSKPDWTFTQFMKYICMLLNRQTWVIDHTAAVNTFINAPSLWWNPSYPFVRLVPSAPSEALRPLLWRHVVHPASRHRAVQCPAVLRWCRGDTNLINKPRRSDSILTKKFEEHGAFSGGKNDLRGGEEIKLDQTKTNSVIPPISPSGHHQWKAVLRPKHLLSGLSLVVPPLNAPLRTEGRRRRHAAKIDLAIFDNRRSV